MIFSHAIVSYRSFLFIMIIASSCPDVKSQEVSPKNYRLPKYIIPLKYDIKLEIKDFKKDWDVPNRVDGEVTIKFRATQEKAKDDFIILNSQFLAISEAKLDNEETSFDFVQESERLLVKNVIDDGDDHTLSIRYRAIMNKDMTGIYYNSYEHGDLNSNRTSWYIATQMAPIYARSVFPCFDEPAFKANFKLTISYPKMFKNVISNTDIESSVEEMTTTNKLIKTTFKETPAISPHLLAFVLMENFKSDSVQKAGVSYFIAFRPRFGDQYEYALDLSPKILKEYEDATGVRYEDYTNGNKVKQIGIPSFMQGAMENWGLILYREEMLFWSPTQSSTETKQAVAAKITHKLGQIWFGNLKTPEWWNAAWLSEGFATFYQFHILAKIESSWELQSQLLVDAFQVAMHYDFASGRPLTLPEASVLDRQRIIMVTDRAFDAITSFKGAAIVRMMQMFMGEEIFNRGIKNFMSKKRSHVVTPRYLWESWKNENGLIDILPKLLSEVMEGWVEKAGFPIVNVVMKDNQVEITATGISDLLSITTEESVWCVPITYTTSKDPNFENTIPNKTNWVIKTEKLILDEDLRAPESWIVVNLQSSAYLRVNYDKTLWRRLDAALWKDHTQFHVLNRIQIVDDVISLALVEKLPFSLTFQVLSYLSRERDYFPWYTAIRGFETLKRRLEDDEINIINMYLRTLFTDFYNTVSNDTDHISSLKRSFAYKAACEMKNKDCLKQMTQKFKEFVEEGVEVEPDLRFVVYCTGLRSKDGMRFWNTLYARMVQTTIPSEQVIIARALGCTEDVNILKQYLGQLFDKTSPLKPHNSEDVKQITSAVIMNSRNGNEALMAFLDEYTKDVVMYPRLVINSILSLASSIRSEKQLNAMRHFADKPQMAAYTSLFNSYIILGEETLKWTKRLRKIMMGPLRARFRKKTKSAGVTATVTKALLFIFVATAFLGIA